ncbi:MAG: tyrosine-type recombinase/integrase, partial [Lachnospiraceae bacterium]|nr:tyrosine-type recombinase/integrase [Lachnospiraceae bacterium]
EFIAKDYSQFCSADIEHYLKQLITKNNLTKKAYVNCKTLLINALKYARRHRLIEYDYNALFKELNGLNRLCSKKGKELEEQVFNDEEMIKLMQELRFLEPNSPRKETLLDFAVMLAALFGLRPGEVTALKYSDFKFTYMKEASLDELNLYTCRKYPNPYLTYAPAKDGKEPCESHKGFMLYYAGEYGEPMDSPTVCEISVTKSEKEKVIKDETKTKNNRKVNVSDPYLDRAFFWSILRADTDPEDFIFRTKDVCIYSEDITKHLKKICSKIGIPERNATALRKSYCMRLIKQGANDAEIIERMGHLTIKTARDYYMRLYETPAEKYETAKKLSSFVK